MKFQLTFAVYAMNRHGMVFDHGDMSNRPLLSVREFVFSHQVNLFSIARISQDAADRMLWR